MHQQNQLTLLIPYRKREPALLSLLKWLQLQGFPSAWPGLTILLLEGNESASGDIQSLCQASGLVYHFLEMGETFHKTKLLNLGLSLTQTRYVTAYDTDLLPLTPATLSRHLQLAITSPSLLISGYRLMLETDSWSGSPTLAELAASAQVAPEDQPTALSKHLRHGERFGVLPMFVADRLQDLGGWDESFVGWGGEDQDMIERYLGQEISLCRVPELVYLHLAHPYYPDWRSPALTERNRQYYYHKRFRLTSESASE